MRCPNDKNLYCNVVNTLFEREVPYYCHKIEAPNVITPCMSQGKVYLLNNDLTTSVIRELNGKNFPACFNHLNGSESQKRIGCQKVRAQLCPAADNLLSPYLTKLLCQLTAMNNNNKSCLWASPILPKKLSSIELAVLVGLLNALRFNKGPHAYAFANSLKAKLVEEILSQYTNTSCGRTPDCAKVQIAEQILPEVERVLETLRPSCPPPVTCGRDQSTPPGPGCVYLQVEDMALRLSDVVQQEGYLRGSLLCQLRDIVDNGTAMNSSLLCASRKRLLAGELMCQLSRVISQFHNDPPACSSRVAHLLGALGRLRHAVEQAIRQLNCRTSTNLITSCEQNLTPRSRKYNVGTSESSSEGTSYPCGSNIFSHLPRCSCCCSSYPDPARYTCPPAQCSYEPPLPHCEVLTASTSASNSRPESVCGLSSSRSRSRSRSGSDNPGHGDQQQDQQLSSATVDNNVDYQCSNSNGGEQCKALSSAISQLKELKLCINGPQIVGYVKSPKTLCEAIYTDLKNSPYLRAHLFRPRKKKRKPKYHYIEIKSTDPCNPQGFFLEFVL